MSRVAVHIPHVHQAVNHRESALAEAAFKRPSNANPGRMSDEEMVRAGLATTAKCSNWWGDTRSALVASAPETEPQRTPDSPALRAEVRRRVAAGMGNQ